MMLLALLDPDSTSQRRLRKLKRRIYRSKVSSACMWYNCTYQLYCLFKGPNFAWHCDGYDKLKPYGLPIHGCIDGYIHDLLYFSLSLQTLLRYSRRVMWLRVAASNNNPRYIAAFFFQCVREIGGCLFLKIIFM